VPEHLPDQLQVAGLLQDAGRSVAPELVRAYLPRETGTDRKPVENVCAVRAAERAAVLVCEQVALRHGVPPGTEPGAKHLRCLGAEESRAVLLSLAAADRDSALAEADVLNSQPQRFADTKAAVRQVWRRRGRQTRDNDAGTRNSGAEAEERGTDGIVTG
jgi:hypothetical protein